MQLQSSPVGSHSANDIRDVLPDLIGGLQPEQVEVAQQVVMEGQELQVQLWQCQAGLPCKYKAHMTHQQRVE